jgi:vacuolar-type H+-ATPase subunit I/STV1
MKYPIFILFLIGICPRTAHSQEKMSDRIQVLRSEVYTRVLNLTPAEAEKFWPIFHEYNNNKENLQKQLRPESDLDNMSDQEVEDYLKKYFEVRQKEFDLEKDMVQKLRKVLPTRKIAKLPKAEREFRESLIRRLQEIREKRQERRPPGGKNR